MRRIGNIFEEICAFENLFKAFKKAYRGSGKNEEPCRFYFNLERELLMLEDELAQRVYMPGQYRYFKIYDPKERTISVAPFRDRVVHHAVIRIIEPFFDRSFIYDSYANRKGKGTHRAIKRAQGFLRRNPYYLKTDIDKYFESIDQDILMQLLMRKLKDKKAMELLGRIVQNSDKSRGIQGGKGLPIGNLTSQFFANVYLDPFDHFIKEVVGVKRYIRYMDDMVFFSDSLEYLKSLQKEMTLFLDHDLRLAIKEKATFINRSIHGLPFLGFRIYPNLIRVKNENLRRIIKGIKKRERAFNEGLLTEERFAMCMRSMFEHIGFANSFTLRQAMLSSKDLSGRH